ncbi:MAG: flagellar biosynthesis protein FlgG [Desulfonatronovibrio sp. MSAO_Bac4]|nr:MAG: flagellar biosynthesis protein FlgG [Desulfonatronovibrio sp. MSAO_Bac4]
MQPIFSVDAFRTSSLSQNITANNLANLNTDQFKAQRLDQETGPDGLGVRPAQVVTDTSPGPAIQRQELIENEQGQTEAREVTVEGSNTDIAKEITTMITDQAAMEANAEVVRTYDHLAGRIIDFLV